MKKRIATFTAVLALAVPAAASAAAPDGRSQLPANDQRRTPTPARSARSHRDHAERPVRLGAGGRSRTWIRRLARFPRRARSMSAATTTSTTRLAAVTSRGAYGRPESFWAVARKRFLLSKMPAPHAEQAEVGLLGLPVGRIEHAGLKEGRRRRPLVGVVGVRVEPVDDHRCAARPLTQALGDCGECPGLAGPAQRRLCRDANLGQPYLLPGLSPSAAASTLASVAAAMSSARALDSHPSKLRKS